MEHNCAIINDKKAFRYRAAAIIVEGNCVLFAGNDVDDYYYSVGGAVHMGETSEEAVKREVLKRQVLITRSITLPWYTRTSSSEVVGIFSGRNIKTSWFQPILLAILFLIGTWIFFGMFELAFIHYSLIYFLLGIMVMVIV